MNNKTIKAIIFDLGRVLINYDYNPYFSKLKKFSNLSEEEIRGLLDYSDLSRQYALGLISTENFYKKSVQRIGAEKLSFEEFQKMWKAVKCSLNWEIEAVLESIKPEIKLLILSNTDESFWHSASKEEIIKKFFPSKDQIILSFELGIAKPDPEIYKEALKRAGCGFGECLFIDDKERNLEQFGILGGNTVQYDCRFTSIEELKNNLATYNIFKV